MMMFQMTCGGNINFVKRLHSRNHIPCRVPRVFTRKISRPRVALSMTSAIVNRKRFVHQKISAVTG